MMSNREKTERCASRPSKIKKKSQAKESISLPTTSDDEWIKICDLIKCNFDLLANPENISEERSSILVAIRNTVNVINDSLKIISTASPAFIELLHSLLKLLKLDSVDMKIRFNIVDIILTLSEKKILQLPSANFIMLLCFLVKQCPAHMDEKHMALFTRKLRKLSKHLHEDKDLKTDCLKQKEVIAQHCRELLTNVRFCVSDLGKDIVANIVALHESFVEEFHNRVKRILLDCAKSDAINIGKIYFLIWELTVDDFRQFIEERCIQWLMEKAFTLGRDQNVVKYLSVNLQSLLSGLHCCRKQAKFSKVITALYEPLLWKFLNNNNNVHRTNAAEIFMNVYPLERPGEGQAVYSRFLRKQHEEMLNLLDDPCPSIRVIAIKGLCANMKYFWMTFQNGTAEQVLKKLITDMVRDGSSYEVRKSVYQGITQLLEEPQSHSLLKCILPTLSKFLHDENQSVRRTYLKMLLKIKYMKTDIKYYHIVDIDNIAARLENDSSANQELIVKLIFSSFYGSKIEIEETYKRLCKFISVSSTASRFLAMYSKDVLKLEEACTLMCMILLIIRNHLKKKLESNEDENKETEENEKSESSSRRSKTSVLTSIENIGEDNSASIEVDISGTTTSSEGSRKTSLSNPEIAHGLFDFVSALWLIHGKELLEPENKQYLDKLYACCIKCIPLASRFYRGTHALFGVIYLSGMIPLSKLQYTTTIIGSCLSMLRQFSENSKVHEYHCVIHVLCLWNRGADVLEIIKEWLDEGFRTQNLNQSFCVKDVRRAKRVKFSNYEAKPTFSLAVLNSLFSSPTDQKCIFTKNCEDLLSIWNDLGKVKILIEKRLYKDSELNEHLSDDFLVKALNLYGNMILLFHEYETSNFNLWESLAQYFGWCDSVLGEGNKKLSNVEEKQQKLAAEFLQAPLVQCVTLIALGKCDEEQIKFLCSFCHTTLNSAIGLYCVETVLKFVKQLILFSKSHHERKHINDIMNTSCPSLLDKILSLLTDKIYTKDTLTRYIKDVVSLRKDFIFVYMLITKIYPKLHHTCLSYHLLHSFCNHLINIVLFPIRECETLNVDQSIKNLPFVGGILAAVFISQIELASGFLFVLKKIVSDYSDKDAIHLLAAASLLYTLAFTRGKIKKSEILKVVQITYTKLESITNQEGCLALVMNHEQTIGERTIIDIEDTTELAIKEIGKHILKMVAEHLGGSLS